MSQPNNLPLLYNIYPSVSCVVYVKVAETYYVIVKGTFVVHEKKGRLQRGSRRQDYVISYFTSCHITTSEVLCYTQDRLLGRYPDTCLECLGDQNRKGHAVILLEATYNT